MAKDYRKGDGYKLYLNTNTYASPTWVEIVAADDLSLNPNINDIEVPERGMDTGHCHGKADYLIAFTLMDDAGTTEVETLISALIDDSTMIHLAVAREDISTTGTKYWHGECALFGELSANQGDVASYDIEAKRHANSDNNFARATA